MPGGGFNSFQWGDDLQHMVLFVEAGVLQLKERSQATNRLVNPLPSHGGTRYSVILYLSPSKLILAFSNFTLL